MTNREYYGQVAGYSLSDLFFKFSGIDPNAEYVDDSTDVIDEQYSKDKRKELGNINE